MHRVVQVVSTVAVVAGSAILVVGGGTAAGNGEARIDAWGWWWQAQQGPVGVPEPPGAQGRLMVEGAPSGPSAVGAVRATLPEGENASSLTLEVDPEGDQGGEAAVLLACPATTDWKGGTAQPWDTQPEADCTQAVEGTRADDGTSWSFPLTLLQSGSEVDVVLVPGANPQMPAGPNGSTFRLVFKPPSSESIEMQAGSAEAPSQPTGEGSDSSDSSTAASSPSASASAAAPPVASPPSASPPAVVAPPSPSGSSAGQPPQRQTELAAPSRASRPPANVRPIADDGDYSRLIGALVLAAGAVGLLWVSRQRAPAPRVLSRFATQADAVAHGDIRLAAITPKEGGLSRFRRPRTTAPRPLM